MLICIVNIIKVSSQNAEHQLSGYIKSIQSINIPGSGNDIYSLNLIHNRINYKLRTSLGFNFRLELRTRIFYGDQINQTPDFGNQINTDDRILKLSSLWLNTSSIIGHSEIDRLQLKYTHKKFDLCIGRQRINWGIHNYWNPNDIFNTFNFLDFDYEERPGTDAIRYQYFNKTESSFDLALKPGKTKDRFIVATLYKFNKFTYDFQLLGGWYEKDIVLGGGWAGGIKNAGWKGEFSYFIPRRTSLESKPTFVLSMMADQSFSEEWYATIAALYQSKISVSGLLPNSWNSKGLNAKNIFPSELAFLGGISKSFSGFISLHLNLVYANQKNLILLLPGCSWNASNNLQIDITIQSYFSEQKTCYGSLGHSVNLRVRWDY